MRKHKYLYAVIILSLACSIPFFLSAFQHSFVEGDDIMTHMQRVEGMLSSWFAGHIPARLHLKTLGNYAYGMGFFYPQLTLIIPLSLRLVGMNFILSTNAFMVIINCLSAFSTYICIYKITDSQKAAFGGSAAALFCFYRLANLFYRGSVGETTVFIFTPILILGLYDIFSHRASGKIFTIIGLAGILYSHLFSFIFTMLILAVFLLFSSPLWIKDKKILIDLVISAIVSALLTASFWIPFLEQFLSVNTVLKTGYDAPYRPALPFRITFCMTAFWWWDLPPYSLDPLIIVFPAALTAIIFGSRKYRKSIIFLLLIGSAGFYLSSDLFPWSKFNALHQILQFPWRMMFLPAVLLPVCFGISIGSINNEKYRLLCITIMTLFCIISAAPLISNIINEHILISPGYRGVQNDIGAGDYLPAGADPARIKEQGKRVLYGKGNEISEYDYSENGLSATLHYGSKEKNTAEIPFLYYKGWYYQIDNEKPMPAEHGVHGLVSISLPAAENGTAHIFYQTTLLQRSADILSIIGFMTLSILIIQRKKLKTE